MRRADLLVKAAGKLQGLAHDLKDAHTVRDEWVSISAEDLRARAEHDELLELAAGLLGMANAGATA